MKKNKNILITALTKDKKFNVYITHITKIAETAQQNQKMNLISSSIFSRALTGGVLLSGNLKNKKDILSLNWKCTGPIENIFVETDFDGNVRGYIGNPNLELIEKSIVNHQILARDYIGLGELVVSRKTFDNRPFYNSVSILETGEIAQDISIYLDQSLQVKSAINIAQSIDKNNNIEFCAGILIMAMPGATEEELENIQKDFLSIGSFTHLLKQHMNNINNAVKIITEKLELTILKEKNVNYKCNCNDNKIINILKSLSKDDFLSFISDDGKIKATCQFCGKAYSFSPTAKGFEHFSK